MADRMNGIELISEEIVPLKHTDKGEKALQIMADLKVNHLPVLKKQNFVGVLSENDLLNQSDLSKQLTELFDHLPRPYVKGTSHIYEVLNIASMDNLSVVPVLDDKENYLGCISVVHLLHKLADTGAIKEQGGIIILEINMLDYSLAHISQIIEGENAKVLSSFITSSPSSNKVELTLKINRIELGSIIKALIRYDYTIKASFQRNSYDDDLKDRYDELMNYLKI
ncbi:MAG: CBS domain-containing protein [Brumimicrobium sp.]|nr:CBS domain-containing protein [Brumimicrobium sp.]